MRRAAGASDLARQLAAARVIVCAGSGGVGKTTTSATIALGLAAGGRRVALVTIDPAARLADALGVAELGGEPARVEPRRFADAGLPLAGELWAMTLDAGETLDALIVAVAGDASTREGILENRIYRQLAGAVAGLQEFAAVARLYELHAEGRYDVIVLDTPPSRNALDFLEAPERLLGLFDSTLVRLLLTPTGLAGRALGRGAGLLLRSLRRLTGGDLLVDIAEFFGAISTVSDGLRARAAAVRELLGDRQTTFLVITSPEREPAAEAQFFAARLHDASLRFGALIVNRVAQLPSSVQPATDPQLEQLLGVDLARKVRRTYDEAGTLAARDLAAVAELRRSTRAPLVVVVPEVEAGIRDADGLVALQRHLFGTR